MAGLSPTPRTARAVSLDKSQRTSVVTRRHMACQANATLNLFRCESHRARTVAVSAHPTTSQHTIHNPRHTKNKTRGARVARTCVSAPMRQRTVTSPKIFFPRQFITLTNSLFDANLREKADCGLDGLLQAPGVCSMSRTACQLRKGHVR